MKPSAIEAKKLVLAIYPEARYSAGVSPRHAVHADYWCEVLLGCGESRDAAWIHAAENLPPRRSAEAQGCSPKVRVISF